MKTAYHKGGGQVKLVTTRPRLAEEISEDRDGPRRPSIRPIQMIERMGEAVVVEGCRFETAQALPTENCLGKNS